MALQSETPDRVTLFENLIQDETNFNVSRSNSFSNLIEMLSKCNYLKISTECFAVDIEKASLLAAACYDNESNAHASTKYIAERLSDDDILDVAKLIISLDYSCISIPTNTLSTLIGKTPESVSILISQLAKEPFTEPSQGLLEFLLTQVNDITYPELSIPIENLDCFFKGYKKTPCRHHDFLLDMMSISKKKQALIEEDELTGLALLRTLFHLKVLLKLAFNSSEKRMIKGILSLSNMATEHFNYNIIVLICHVCNCTPISLLQTENKKIKELSVKTYVK